MKNHIRLDLLRTPALIGTVLFMVSLFAFPTTALAQDSDALTDPDIDYTDPCNPDSGGDDVSLYSTDTPNSTGSRWESELVAREED